MCNLPLVEDQSPNDLARFGVDLTSVHKSTLNDDGILNQTESQNFLMAGMERHRTSILHAMVNLKYTEKMQDRFASCCQHSTVIRHSQSHELKLASISCGQRFCPHCGNAYRKKVAQKIEDLMGRSRQNVWRFITLTIRSSNNDLKTQIAFLKASFRRLRQTTLWQTTQLMGYGVIEMTWSSRRLQWHPHIHIVSRGVFVSQASLSKQWAECSKGSEVVDIRKIKSSPTAATELCSYLTKMPNIPDDDGKVGLMTELLAALKGTHMLIPFGVRDAIADDLDTQPTETYSNEWEFVCTFDNLLKRISNGDISATEMYDELKGRYRGPVDGDNSRSP